MIWIFDMTMAMSVTAAVILLFKRVFKDKLSARCHLWIWILLLIRLIIPNLPESPLSVLNVVPEADIVFEESVGVDPAAADGTIELFRGNDFLLNPDELVVMVWGAGAVLLMLYFAAVSIIFSIRTNRRKPINDKSINDILAECKARLGMERGVAVVEGDDTPMMAGFLRPKIIVGAGYTSDEIENIFLHELCHLKHGDVLKIWVGVAVLCLNWFNPIAWYAFREFRRDIEVYCDEKALRYCDNKKQYAALLLKTALGKELFVPGTTALRSGEKEVERRISYMANFKKPGIVWSLIIALVVLVIASVCLTNGVSGTADADVGDGVAGAGDVAGAGAGDVAGDADKAGTVDADKAGAGYDGDGTADVGGTGYDGADTADVGGGSGMDVDNAGTGDADAATLVEKTGGDGADKTGAAGKPDAEKTGAAGKPDAEKAGEKNENSKAEKATLVMVYPVQGEISAGFKKNPVTGKLHEGVDFRANEGDSVSAAADGTVAEVGYNSAKGNYIKLKHGNGIETVYAHLKDTNVEAGAKVASGDIIGTVGKTGMATGPNLHFELIDGGKVIDPQLYME